MKLAALTICYNEEQFLGAVIGNWKNIVDKHLVLHSDKPWHGAELPPDQSEDITRSFKHTEFFRVWWHNEHIQRNWGLGRLAEYDYVIIVDADELYTRKDQETILNTLGTGEKTDCYVAQKVKTYFKTLQYALDPADTHHPIIAINPKKLTFSEYRGCAFQQQIWVNATMHHLTYVRQDERLKYKLGQFEHYLDVRPEWWNFVWKNWTPEMEDVRAYGRENSRAILNPAPQEIIDLINKYGKF